ncbi:MAG: YraN family protein [Patescibacteria group bacterium]
MDERRKFGNSAEEVATRYLKQKGYEILDRNYQKPWGEIDIIAKQENIMVFVEVKANSHATESSFSPEVRADYLKLRKVIRTAKLYLNNLEREWRIDVISVTMGQDKARITHFKNVAEDSS